MSDPHNQNPYRDSDLDGLVVPWLLPPADPIRQRATLRLIFQFEQVWLRETWAQEKRGFDPFTARQRARKKINVTINRFEEPARTQIHQALDNSQ